MREDAGVSMAALARAAGVPPSFVWRIFQGDERPSFETYARLDGKRQAEFERMFQLRRKGARHLLRMRELAEVAGAEAVVGEQALWWAQRAVRALDGLPEGPYRALLERIARTVAGRRA